MTWEEFDKKWGLTPDQIDKRLTDATRVCDVPGCLSAVVRRDDGSRACGSGHPSRWVEREELNEAISAMNFIFNQGHNDDCLFCGFKDKIALQFLRRYSL
jgi:hypothetical protein